MGPVALADEFSKAPETPTTAKCITAPNLLQCLRSAIPGVLADQHVPVTERAY